MSVLVVREQDGSIHAPVKKYVWICVYEYVYDVCIFCTSVLVVREQDGSIRAPAKVYVWICAHGYVYGYVRMCVYFV